MPKLGVIWANFHYKLSVVMVAIVVLVRPKCDQNKDLVCPRIAQFSAGNTGRHRAQ